MWVVAVAAFFVGGFVGFFVSALCNAAARADEVMRGYMPDDEDLES